jgi:hypothetical protein
MRLYFSTISSLCLLGACASGTDKASDFGTTPTDTGSGETGETGDPSTALEGEVVLSPRDNVSDLVIDGDVLYYSTEYDPAVYLWNPDSGAEEKVAWDYRDLEAFTVAEGRYWGSFSDTGIEGWVSEILPPKEQEEWAAKGSDGTLFRRPGDIAVLNGGVVLVDTKLNVVWKAESDGSASVVAEGESVLCLAIVDGQLIYGGDAGVFSESGDLIDARSVFALGEVEGKAFGIHPEHGFFPIGENKSWELAGPPRPGPFVWRNNYLYSVDEVGGAIWRFSLEP